MAKKALNIITLCVISVLILCTFASKIIFDARTPIVETVRPTDIELDGEYFSMAVPCRAVVTGANNIKFVYVARERKGIFGSEYYIETAEVSVLAENAEYCAIGGRNVTDIDEVVISSNANIADDIVVMISGNK